MKKWILILLIAVLLAGLATVTVYLHTLQLSPASPTTQATVPVQTQPVFATGEAETTQPQTIPPTQPLPDAIMPEDYTLTARHAFVYDCGSETLVYSMGDQTESIAPASLTKLLTIYVAMQHLQPDTIVTAGDEVTRVDPASSLALVSDGDRLSAELLVEGMLLQSGNDAAYALAVAAGRVIAGEPGMPSGLALDAFMDELNAQAQALGLYDTHFVTPDGLDADGHCTTPADMLKLTKLLMDDPMIMNYAGIATDTVTFADDSTRDWTNTNYLLHQESPYYCPEACGLKTGYTSKAGACMIALFHTGGRYLIVGVFGAPKYEDRAADALYLYEQYR